MLITTIQEDIKNAMLKKEKQKLTTLRLLLATIEKKKTEKKLKDISELKDEDVLDAISKNLKTLDQEIDALQNVGRDTTKQEAEKELLMAYMPKQMNIEEIQEVVTAITSRVKEAGGNMGVAMKEATLEMKGKADMKLVSQMVKEGMKN